MGLAIELNCKETHSLSCNPAAATAKGRWFSVAGDESASTLGWAVIGTASLVTESARSAKLRISLGSSYSRRMVSSCATNQGLGRPLKN